MRRLLGWAGGGLALLLAATVTALLLAPASPPPPGPEPGRALYRAHCATCHGADGRGGTWRARLLWLGPGDLTTPEATALAPAYLADLLRHGGASLGKPGMPSFGFVLGDEEIQAIIRYVRTLPATARP